MEGEGKGGAQTDVPKRTEGGVVGGGCGPAQPREPILITANFSSTKQALDTLQFPVSFMPWQFDMRLPLCLTHERIYGKKNQTIPNQNCILLYNQNPKMQYLIKLAEAAHTL